MEGFHIEIVDISFPIYFTDQRVVFERLPFMFRNSATLVVQSGDCQLYHQVENFCGNREIIMNKRFFLNNHPVLRIV